MDSHNQSSADKEKNMRVVQIQDFSQLLFETSLGSPYWSSHLLMYSFVVSNQENIYEADLIK